MKIKVNYESLTNKSKEIKKESEELNNEIDKLIAYLEEVKQAWKGRDSEIFTGKAEAYFKNMKQVAVSLDGFSKFAEYADNNYYEHDKSWKEEVEKAGGNFGNNELKLRN